MPGVRDDPAHRLGFDLADAILAPWPAAYGAELAPALAAYDEKVTYVGAVSRFDGRPRVGPVNPAGPSRRALVMSGTGGSEPFGAAQPGGGAVPGWDCHFIGADNWLDDPWRSTFVADVVVSHAGLGALADLAAARRPTVVVPQMRPHDEQVATGRVLARAGLATVTDQLPSRPADWQPLLEAALLGGSRWASWSSGEGGRRMANVVHAVRDRWS